MRSIKGCFMLVVAFILTLNNFFYAVNPAAAKPIFDWIDPCLSGCHPYPLHLGCSQFPE